MKTFLLLLISFPVYVFAQQNLSTKDTRAIEADHFWGVDNFEGIYYSENNTFSKQWNHKLWQFSDFSLGDITQVSILNPLQIVLFYEHTNTIVLLDKYLTEIKRINFNNLADFKNIAYATIAYNGNLWIFDINSQQLELFDTRNQNTIVRSIPISKLPIDQDSNFNNCWLMTENNILKINQYGNITNTIQNDGFIELKTLSNYLLLKKENQLYLKSISDNQTTQLLLPEITIQQFYVAHEILYIYDQTKLYSFALTIE